MVTLNIKIEKIDILANEYFYFKLNLKNIIHNYISSFIKIFLFKCVH